MKTEEQYFLEGQTVQGYMENMSTLKEESFYVYQQFVLPKDGFMAEFKQHSLHFLAVTEDWCGDAMMIIPVIRKIAEAADIDMRVVLRDENTELIDRHLTNGGRAIPIIFVLNDQGELIGKWGPRAPEVQQLVNDMRHSLPPKDDPSFEEKQKQVYSTLKKRYAEDDSLWNYVYNSFKKTVLAALS
ncbi:Thiol-disulfide isomerase or thioredoxin [Alteribacillus persepolensis]|uniref:Thiol-disulfide isomerase or thioredoxin n=1 Tax=Alteribacillus persepolensis TaxID=568899 RepID=A0A1G8F7T3_9BACI|nr:thioredoxin family protein [Alteribacillus persepolensis]SDH78206.1 Thiol-disulfide isomerase or thioredoxin [Alteribacillus persepolensis]